MSTLKKYASYFCVILTCSVYITTANAAPVKTADVVNGAEKAKLVRMLERDDVKQKLVDMGVDPQTAVARVDQMNAEEIAQLSNRIDELPAGAGVSTVDLLLIIIILILVL